MKKTAILAGVVLFAGMNMGFAAEMEGLWTGLELSRISPEAIKNIEVQTPEKAQLETEPARANDTGISIVIKGAGELKAAGSAIFMATNDSFSCTEFSWNEGSAVRVPKRIYPEFEQRNGLIKIPADIESKCGYTRVNEGSLNFSIPGVAEAYNTVSLFRNGGSAKEQEVVCEQILSGPKGDQEMIMCHGDINLDDNGKATVKVIYK